MLEVAYPSGSENYRDINLNLIDNVYVTGNFKELKTLNTDPLTGKPYDPKITT